MKAKMQCCCGKASRKGYDANVVQEAHEAWEDVVVRDANFFLLMNRYTHTPIGRTRYWYSLYFQDGVRLPGVINTFA